MRKIFFALINMALILTLSAPATAAITNEDELNAAMTANTSPLEIGGDITLSYTKFFSYPADITGLSGSGSFYNLNPFYLYRLLTSGAGPLYTISTNNEYPLFHFNITPGTISNLGFNQGYSKNGVGGALYVQHSLVNDIIGCVFSNNRAKYDGGAIFVYSDLQGRIVNSLFINNRSENDSGGALNVYNISGNIINSVFEANIANVSGGAVYLLGNLTGGISDGSLFTGNSATGGSGGAVYVGGNLAGSISGSTFRDNSAGNNGGAVYVEGNLTGSITGSTFQDNSAGYGGGAVYVKGNLTGDFSGSTFQNNSALYMGGALLALGNMELSGADMMFIDNHADGVAGNGATGLGGAVFYDAGQTAGSPAKIFSLSATSGEPVIFVGNTHNPGQTGTVLNSIYFGNSMGNDSGASFDGQVNATFNVAEDGALYLLDPIASQADDLTFDLAGYGPSTLSNIALNINKTGPGVWTLAGYNHMQSATNWMVSEGYLQLVADVNGAPARIDLANTTNAMSVTDYASFTVKNGAGLLVEPAKEPHQISGRNITLEAGSSVGIKGFQYGPVLSEGRYLVLALDANSVDNQSGVPRTAGTITIGVNSYDYYNLHWEGSNALYLDLSAPQTNNTLSGVPSITGSSHIAALNPAFNIFSYHAKGLFGRWNSHPYQERAYSSPLEYARVDNAQASDSGYLAVGEKEELSQLWIAPNYVNINQSGGNGNVGYLLQTPGFALGFDSQINESAFIGMGVSVSWPDYSSDDIEITASDITFAIYGGARLPYTLELSGHAGFGFTRYDQNRQVMGERYSEKYNGNNFFAGVALGRPFALGANFSLRPGVAYDFINLNVDGFRERRGVYAIRSEDYSQNIHKVKAGFDLSWTDPESGLIANGEVYYLGVYGDRGAQAGGYFVNDPVNGFTMLGNDLDRDNLGLGLKLSLPVNERCELGAGYNVLFGADTVAQQGILEATIKF